MLRPMRVRSWLPSVLAAALVAVLGWLFLARGGPGEDAAVRLVEGYLDAKIADGCGHYAYYSEQFARTEHVDVKDCQADEAFAEGEYFEYDVGDVRVDGDRAEVDVEDESDAPRGPFTVVLVVEDDAWRIAGIEERSDASPEALAERWVEVNNDELEDCSVLDLYSDDYVDAQQVDPSRCQDDPGSFFTYWFMEAETHGSTFEVGDTQVEGGQATVEVLESGGLVPSLRLFLVADDGEWRIDAVGAALPSS
jgi:hypothetical protein